MQRQPQSEQTAFMQHANMSNSNDGAVRDRVWIKYKNGLFHCSSGALFHGANTIFRYHLYANDFALKKQMLVYIYYDCMIWNCASH